MLQIATCPSGPLNQSIPVDIELGVATHVSHNEVGEVISANPLKIHWLEFATLCSGSER